VATAVAPTGDRTRSSAHPESSCRRYRDPRNQAACLPEAKNAPTCGRRGTSLQHRSGRTFSTPVILVENGERWLVAPYGEVNWVRNARAAGRVTLSRGRHRDQVKISEVGSQESAPVLREYLRRVRTVRPFFDVSPDSPLEAFAAEAGRHPVFRIEPLMSS
jgi:hypothetical protein